MRIGYGPLALCLIMAMAPVATAADGGEPIVVELFTSQGCSSCPPADALLAELAQRPDVIALGYHVDYWDHLGWKDPLSSPQATARQRDYARHFGRNQVYTPQLVVDGSEEAVGSDRAAVTAAIRRASPPAAAPVTIAADRRSVSVGKGTGTGNVLLARFARSRRTAVSAGENASHILQDANGVESLVKLGEWTDAETMFPLDPPGPGEGVAVLVQAADGHILGAAMAVSDE